MPLISTLIFQILRWSARKGLRDDSLLPPSQPNSASSASPHHLARNRASRAAGLHGETFAYWYLRRLGYVFVARNYTPRGAHGEIDLIGYDGDTLAFVEVRMRTVRDELTALPELSVTTDKQRVLIRTAQRFLLERHPGDCPCRFDVLAIDNRPGLPPELRLHKDAFSPQLH